MKEIADIIRAFQAAQAQGRQSALATVVHVEGSAYRRPGARMLVTDQGELTGAISGGCLEGDALKKALFVMERKTSMLVTYDTMDDDDAALGVGLGCNGIIQVLIEPIDPSNENNPLALLQKACSIRQRAVLVTLFSLAQPRLAQQGTCLLLQNGLMHDASAPAFYAARLHEDAQQAMVTGQSGFKNYQHNTAAVNAFIECLEPPVSLVIAGAGNDTIPLVKMADILGWQTIIADGRPAYLKPQRFAASCQVILSKPEELLQKINIDDRTVFVLMTHNYHYDYAMLAALIRRGVRYIGSLGPRKKMDRMVHELEASGIVMTQEQRASLFGPAGLNIGAETPEEIALSIIAEIQAVLAGREGQSLRMQSSFIHPRADSFIEQINIPG